MTGARSRARLLRAVLATIAGWSTVGTPAHAGEPPTFGATNSLRAERHADNANQNENDDDFFLVLERLDTSGSWSFLTLNARAEGWWYDRYPSPRQEDELRLARFSARATRDGWSLLAGDGHTTLGRGIVLAVPARDDAQLDTAIRGGHVRLDGELGGIELIGGWTRSDVIDPISLYRIEEVDDRVGGARGTLAVPDGPGLSLIGSWVEAEEQVLGLPTRTVSAGLTVDWPAPLPWLAFYGEADGQRRSLAGTESDGWAGYFTIDAFRGDTTFLVEGLALEEFEMRGSTNSALGSPFQYSQPPTLEPLDQEIATLTDVRGGHAGVMHYFPDAALDAELHGVLRIEHPGDDEEVRDRHGWGGLSWEVSDSAVVDGRGGIRDARSESGHVRTIVHGDVQWTQNLAERLALKLSGRHERRLAPESDFVRGDGTVELSQSRIGSLALIVGWNTQDTTSGVRQVFVAGMGHLAVSEIWDLRLLGGTMRGGLLCVSGVCREHPAFAGVRAELVVRY